MNRSFTGAAWAVLQAPEPHVAWLRQRHRLSDVAARVLALRFGERPPDPGWLEPSPDHFHDPGAMYGMDAALDVLRHAIARGRKIRIITDYDVDGTTSSLILQAALRLVAPSVTVDYHIPDRFRDGYGFSVAAADAAADDGVGLIVTADIGVRDHEAVARARERGLHVLVCDHHLPEGASVPEGATVLCPPQGRDTYPNKALAACGISLKVADGLLAGHARRDDILRSLLKLAAIGTVADMVSLSTLENRAIVALGLRELNRGPHTPGLAALMATAGLEPGGIREQELAFRVAPRINAAGRIESARLVVELLTSRDPDRARALAADVDRLNTERKGIQARLVEVALAASRDRDDPFVVVAGPEADGWHRGVVGIVAARLREELHRPVAVVGIQGARAVGSVRSVPGVHAVQALTHARDLLVKFGGHPVAAGFTVPTDRLDALRERLCAYVREHAAKDALDAVREADADCPAGALDDGLWRELESLGPFGVGNPRPRLLVRGVHARAVDVRGGTGRMLKFVIPKPAGGVEAVWWDRAEHAEALRSGPVDVLGELAEHRWKGRRTLQFQVTDVRRA